MNDMTATLSIEPGDETSPVKNVRAGRVISTSGTEVIILLDREATHTGSIQVGCLIRVRSPHATVYGVVEGMSTPAPVESGDIPELKIAEIGLLGEVTDPPESPPVEFQPSFRRGVSKLPSLDAEVYLATQEDTEIVYALVRRQTVTIGSIYQNPRVPARISVNDMLCKHFAILGTTGTGKSCALTLVLKRILEQSPNGHVLLLDPHGEYGHAFGSSAECLTVENFRLPFWLCTFEEFVEMVFSYETEEASTEVMHLRELVLATKIKAAKYSREWGTISVDSAIPYSISDLIRLLETAIGSLDNRSNLPSYLRLKARLTGLQSDSRYNFLFDNGMVVKDNFTTVLGRLIRVPTNGKPLAILDLASIPSELLNVVVAVICRLAFDFAVHAGQRWPLLLVCEEAHRYAPRDAALGFEPAKRALSRIAKEGRKYGISLGLISQRPSELASTILSQCNTVFAFRMSNERDQEIIQATIAEASAAMFSVLPFLGSSEAIAIGEGISVPMRIRFDMLAESERPRSSSASFSDRWQEEEINTVAELDNVAASMRGRTLPGA
jgi:DNA helicase HerA-like ATPase